MDFNVYYCAGDLVRSDRAAQIYTGADTGVNPQEVWATTNLPIGRAALANGLPGVGLYVYPPLLADLAAPFTATPLPRAAHLWLALNFAFLLLTAILLARLFGLPLLSPYAALLIVAVFAFTPALQAFTLGQITITLLLLWVAGLLLYRSGYPIAAGAIFALAAALKLTPVLVLLPFIFWRAWRVVGGFVFAGLLMVAFCLTVNSPHVVLTYFTRVLPAMAGPTPDFSNYSLSIAVARLWTAVSTGTVAPRSVQFTPDAIRAGKFLVFIVIGTLLLLLARLGPRLRYRDRLVVLALFGLLAPILSPVSWFHAYATAFVAFAVLWHEALTARLQPVLFALLLLVSLCLASPVFENILPSLALSSQGTVAAAVLQCTQLLAAVALVLGRLWVMPLDDAPTHP